MRLKVAFAILVSLLVLALPISGQQTPPVSVEMKVRPYEPLSKRWAIVVDNSHSMRGIFRRARGAFIEATGTRSDQLEFCVIAFNNQSMERFRDWVWATDDELSAAAEWLEEDKVGVLSYGVKAVKMAIEQERDDLTVVLITDGGFTEASRYGFDHIENAIEASQRVRDNLGLARAIVCCFGISNPAYRGGNKPSDEECQAFLRRIGTVYHGGYWLVKDAK